MTLRTKAHVLIVSLSLIASVGTVATRQAVAPNPKTAALEQRLPVDPRVTVGDLPNGLRYYVQRNQQPAGRAELRLVVNAGSVLEDADQQGLAHFTEHMAFNGTVHFPKQELVKFMESIGMKMGPSVNAFTSFDETVYMLQVPTDKPEVMEKAFLILEDWAHNLTFDPAEIDKERGVIVEEWRLGRGAGARIQDKQFPILMKGSRYAERLPIGKKEIVEAFTHDRLKQFYADWYRPNLMAVIAVGDFDPTAIRTLITQHFGPLKNPAKPRPRSIFGVPDHPGTLYAPATDKEMTMTTVSLYQKRAVRAQDTVKSYRDKIVERLYFGMLNSRLSDLARTPDPPFIMGNAAAGRFVKSKEAVMLAALVKDGGVERGLDAVCTEAERVARFGFTATELDRQKRIVLRNYERLYTERDKRESALKASEYIRAFTQGEDIPGPEWEYELHQRFLPEITLDEVSRVGATLATDRNRVVLVSGPQKEGVTLPGEVKLAGVFKTVASKKIEPYVDTAGTATLMDTLPAPGTIARAATRDPNITEWDLANGVRVVLKPNAEKPDEVVFRAARFGGTSLASDQDYIAASTAAQVLRQSGLGRFSATDLRKVLAGKVASATPSISETEEGLSGGGSPKDLETILQMIYLNFTQPRVDAQMFEVIKAQMKASLANQSASPDFAFYEALETTVTQNHLRSRPMTLQTLEEMNLDRSLAFYKDRFADASGFTFVFAGNFEVDAIRPLVERYLGSLPSLRRNQTWKDVGMRYAKGVVRKTVEKGLEPQSQVALVFTGPFQYDAAHRVIMRTLGSVLQTRLRNTIREDLSGTYGISASPSYAKEPEQRYRFDIAFGCNPQRVNELVAAVMKEIDALRTTGPTEKEVNDVREQLLRDFEVNIKQNSYLTTQMYFKYLHGEDVGELFRMPEAYKKLTPAAIQEAARAYLNTENYVQVVLMPEKKTAAMPVTESVRRILRFPSLVWQPVG
jgi:zinc protease